MPPDEQITRAGTNATATVATMSQHLTGSRSNKSRKRNYRSVMYLGDRPVWRSIAPRTGVAPGIESTEELPLVLVTISSCSISPSLAVALIDLRRLVSAPISWTYDLQTHCRRREELGRAGNGKGEEEGWMAGATALDGYWSRPSPARRPSAAESWIEPPDPSVRTPRS